MVSKKSLTTKKTFFFFTFLYWEKQTWYWDFRLVGNGAEIQPLEKGRKSPGSFTFDLSSILWAVSSYFSRSSRSLALLYCCTKSSDTSSGFLKMNHDSRCTIINPLPHSSDFIWDFRKLPFPSYLEKYFIKIEKIRAKIHEFRKIKAIFGLGMTPI